MITDCRHTRFSKFPAYGYMLAYLTVISNDGVAVYNYTNAPVTYRAFFADLRRPWYPTPEYDSIEVVKYPAKRNQLQPEAYT